MRSALFFAAGSMKLGYRHLFIFDGLAALIEVPLLVYAVRYVGGRWERIVDVVQRYQGAVISGALLLLLLAPWLVHRR